MEHRLRSGKNLSCYAFFPEIYNKVASMAQFILKDSKSKQEKSSKSEQEKSSISPSRRLSTQIQRLSCSIQRLSRFNIDFEHPTGTRTRKDKLKGYRLVVHVALVISNSTFFSSFMILWIVVAAVIIGMETYPAMSDLQCLDALNWAVSAFFTLEVALKLVSEGSKPWLFFIGPERGWNIFNFIIVMACYFNFRIHVKQMRILRIIRVFRVAKLVKEIPQVRVIIMGLLGCISKITYTALFLTMTYYIYALVGLELFRENDPFFFGCLHHAVLTMFKSSTMEDWHDVMYINLWGCDKWPHHIYVPPDTKGRDIVFWCSHSQGSKSAIIFFVSFILVAALVLMSLVVGGIMLEMEKTIILMKEEAMEAQRQNIFKRKMKRAEKIAAIDANENPLSKKISPQDFIHAAKAELLKTKNGNTHALHKEPSKTLRRTKTFISKKERQNILLKTLMLRAWAGMDITKLQEEQFYFDHPIFLVRWYARFSLACSKIVESKIFGLFILGIIFCASVVIGIESMDSLTASQLSVLSTLDFTFAVAFTIEAAGKIIAEEFEPWRYFLSSWNIFDFVVVIGSLMSVCEVNSKASGRIFMILRLLRILRVLKLVKQLPFLQIVVIALLKSSQSIVSLGLIIFLFDYTFAVIGLSFFATNDPMHFGALHVSMINLFKISTREDWSESLFINAYGCDQQGYEEWPWLCQHPEAHYLTSVLFHVIFVGICALVLLALFIGVVTTTMQQEGEFLTEKKRVQKRVTRVQTKYQLTNECIKMYRDVFDFLDMDGGGTIGAHELEMGLKAVGKHLTPEELDILFSKVDTNQSGEIDVSEMIEGFAIMRFQEKQAERKPVKPQKQDQGMAQLGTEVKSRVQKLARSSIDGGKRISIEGVEVWEHIKETLKLRRAAIHCCNSKDSESIMSPTGYPLINNVPQLYTNPNYVDGVISKCTLQEDRQLETPSRLIQTSSRQCLIQPSYADAKMSKHQQSEQKKSVRNSLLQDPATDEKVSSHQQSGKERSVHYKRNGSSKHQQSDQESSVHNSILKDEPIKEKVSMHQQSEQERSVHSRLLNEFSDENVPKHQRLEEETSFHNSFLEDSSTYKKVSKHQQSERERSVHNSLSKDSPEDSKESVK